jgi:hypothetical protein
VRARLTLDSSSMDPEAMLEGVGIGKGYKVVAVPKPLTMGNGENANPRRKLFLVNYEKGLTGGGGRSSGLARV